MRVDKASIVLVGRCQNRLADKCHCEGRSNLAGRVGDCFASAARNDTVRDFDSALIVLALALFFSARVFFRRGQFMLKCERLKPTLAFVKMAELRCFDWRKQSELEMNQIRFARVGAVAFLFALTLMLGYVLGVMTPKPDAFAAQASATATPLPTPTRVPDDPIPLKPLTGLTGLAASVTLDVNGEINAQRAQGTLNATVMTNLNDQSKITVTGPLLGDIVAQVGGAAVSLFSPSQVDIYKVPQGTFIVVKSFLDVCVKPADPNATAATDNLSPQALLTMLTSPEVARGKFVGEETRNGIQVKHYVINGAAFLAAAQNSQDPNLKEFAAALWQAQDAHVYVSAEGYPVAFEGSYSGEFEPLKFKGNFDVRIDLTSINQPTQIDLPRACNNPITP